MQEIKAKNNGKKIQIGYKASRKTNQSICTHYSCFENMGRFVTLKKKVQTINKYQADLIN
jgi:hypothetical protein